MKKRILSALLTVIMVVGLVPTTVFAAEGDHTHGDSIAYDTKWSGSKSATYISKNTNIVLTDDVTFSGNMQISVGKTVNLCLNGKTLDMGSFVVTVYNNGALHICDCGGGGKITGSSYQGTISAWGTGAISISGGTISNSANYTVSGTDGPTTVTGGKIISSTGYALYNSGSGKMTVTGSAEVSGGMGIYNRNGVVEVSGGTVVGQNFAIAQLGTGNITICGGTVSSTNSIGVNNNDSGTVTVSGNAHISGTYGIQNRRGTVYITGGTVEGKATWAIYNHGDNGVVEVSGGTITSASKEGIYNEKETGIIYLSGSPSISGNPAAISNGLGSVYAQSSDGSSVYVGGDVSVCVRGPSLNKVAVKKVTADNENKFILANTPGGYFLKKDGENLVLGLPHTHVWATEWSKDDTAHWHECTAADCDVTENSQKDSYGAHTPKNADRDCTTAETCECGYQIKAAEAEHDFSGGNLYDESGHWHKCERCDATDAEYLHSFTVLQNDGTHHWNKCAECDATDTKVEHTFSIPQNDDTNHWNKCSDCDAIGTKVEHTGGTATCTAKAVCTDCQQPYGDLKSDNHAGRAEWTQTATTHKQAYTCCNTDVVAQEDHEWENGVCTECNYTCIHTGGTATCTDEAVCTSCGTAYGALNPADHAGSAEWTQTATTHKQAYACCGVIVVTEEAHEWTDGVCTECAYVCQHTGGTATCTDKAVCISCGHKYGDLAPDNHASAEFTYTSNSNGTHKKTHKCCGVEVEAAESCTYGTDRTCDLCGYTKPSSGNSSGSTRPNNTTTETVKNDDGSTTTTTTNKVTGTVTETTKYPDGSTETVETKKDGTVTTTVKDTTGSTGTTTVDEDGAVTTEVKVTSAAVKDANKTDEPVALPIPAVDADDEPVVEVTLPKGSDDVVVSIPVDDVTPGTVAVLVKDDGTEEVIRKAVTGDDELIVPLDGSATIKIVDATKTFTDTRGHWAEDAIDFVTARELYSGTGVRTFTPDGVMTRAMLAMVLHNLEGNPEHNFAGSFHDLDGHWATDAIHWAAERGIVSGYPDGTYGPELQLTREQLAVMLWNYAGTPESDHDLSRFVDADSISPYARTAMAWANENGIINGMSYDTLAPQGLATRAQVSVMLMKFCDDQIK